MPRVSDDDLKSYSDAKTWPNTPGEDLRMMALELIAARKVIEKARDYEIGMDYGCGDGCETLRDLIAIYDGTVSAPASSDSGTGKS